jgi:hypothetical protein
MGRLKSSANSRQRRFNFACAHSACRRSRLVHSLVRPAPASILPPRPLSLSAAARRACQGWPRLSRPPEGLGLDWPEHGGILDRIGAAGVATWQANSNRWLRSKPTPIDPHESGGGGRSLDLRTTQRHEAEPAFKLTMVVKNRPPHPYIRWIRWIRTMMQLCASRARLRSSSSPFFFPVQRPWGDGGLPLPRIAFGRFVAMRAEVPKPGISSSFLSPITPLNAA